MLRPAAAAQPAALKVACSGSAGCCVAWLLIAAASTGQLAVRGDKNLQDHPVWRTSNGVGARGTQPKKTKKNDLHSDASKAELRGGKTHYSRSAAMHCHLGSAVHVVR